ncbi:glycosyltransferase family 4 protein [Vibrio lentus]|uniref:glycosyltransferase family 4 protein n=1 Tax=Vibrio lentus TaxID=136468 RepID=UPI002468F28D|nr:glycosyltransferase family 4 protein [Vibrio lentus]MDH5929503.1 glycosyltransferase family 4 protein [Vibrio lentus]
MKIAFLTKYSDLGASSRLRSYQYIPLLKEKGHSVKVYPFFDSNYLKSLYAGNKISKWSLLRFYFRRLINILRLSKFDVVVIEKECFPYLPSFFEMLAPLVNRSYIIDYDDAIFHNYDTGSAFKKAILSNKLDYLIRNSKVVHVGNDYLGNYMTSKGATTVKYLPTVVDFGRYNNAKIPKFSCKNDIVIGWIGSPSTTKYLVNLIPTLEMISKEFNIRLLAIGASPIESELLEIEVIEWTEDSEVASLSRIDVGVMPLNDSIWEQGKCGYKLIQYLALGKPVIASPIGVNNFIVDESVGFLASSESEWYEKIRFLVSNEDMRNNLGENGKRRVEQIFSLSVASEILNSSLEDIYEN